MSAKPITIIGGGLAGLALGIGLRHRGVPVRILEAGHYPRHRVCGEFISGRGQQVLKRLGLMESLRSMGATLASEARFYLASSAGPPRRIPTPALCISRYRLDSFLADKFRGLGGELSEGNAWHRKETPEGWVHANGRRAVAVEKGWRWFGLKVHATSVRLDADLEMHCFDNGYVGLCRLGTGQVNICGLFRRHPAEPHGAISPKELLLGGAGGILHERLHEARFDAGSFCAVAGLPMRPQRAATQAGCRIGDALTMIAPLTGNGMSMAFEAAELATAPLAKYSAGELGWIEARNRVAQSCDAAFASRLRWATGLQELLLAVVNYKALIPCLLSSKPAWQFLFARTR